MSISRRAYSNGFALPTVVITSVVLFAVLIAVLGVVSSSRVAVDTQFYESLAMDAAESGGAHADVCMKDNELISPWSVPAPGRPLKLETDCSGATVTGRGKYLIETPTYRTYYSVSPAQTSSTGVQTSTVTGTVEVLRQSTGAVWKTRTKTLMVKSGGLVGVNDIAFGYVIQKGAFFGSVGNDGVMRTVGFNERGQLGNGTTTSVLKPTNFTIPGKKIIAAYTSFLSLGYNMFAVTSDGEAYGAGINDAGRIGDYTMDDRLIPSKVIFTDTTALPIRYIAVGQASNYFLGNNGRIYSAGSCDKGRLGIGGVCDGYFDGSIPKEVPLPAGTRVTKIVTDSDNAYAITTDGALYGWGSNEFGQLGNGNYTNSSTPVKFGVFGDIGKSKIVDLQFDGETVYALADTGVMYSAGRSSLGQTGSRTIELYNPLRNVCVTVSGSSVVLAGCNGSVSQQFTKNADGTVYNAGANACLYDQGSTVGLQACNAGSGAQQFYDHGWQALLVNGKFFTAESATSLKLLSADSGEARTFYHDTSTPRAMNMTCLGAQKITKLSADQWSVSFMTDAGRVYSLGYNSGHFGNGVDGSNYNPDCQEFKLPAGVTAKDLYATMSSQINGYPEWQFANLFVIGSDNRIYGAGSNYYGQLGLGAGTINTTNVVSTPQAMTVIDGVNIKAGSVKVGFGTTVVLSTTNRVYTVGNNSHGQLGDGTTQSNPVPKLNRYTNEFRTIYY